MKRLLCILSSLDAGGAETFLMKICRALPPGEYQFDFIVSRNGGCYTQEVLERGGRIYCIPMRTKDPLGAMRGIKTVVKENQYNYVLKLGDTPLAALDLIAAKLGGAKKLIIRSCNALTGQTRVRKLIDTLLRPLLNGIADVKIAPSMLAAEFTFGKKQAQKHVHLLHNAVDLQMYHYDSLARTSFREEFSLEGKLIVGHVGRFSKQKNHRFLLEIFRQIKNQNHNAVLVLVGSGELEVQIRQQAVELGIESSVIFTGVRFDIPQILSSVDVFVFPSFYEGMPNTVIEAQATGLPCVIADTITREANITGLVHYLSLDQSAQQWAGAAVAAVSDVRKDTKQNFVNHGYDIESVAQEFVSLIFFE